MFIHIHVPESIHMPYKCKQLHTTFYTASSQKRLSSGENAIRVIVAAGQTVLANSND